MKTPMVSSDEKAVRNMCGMEKVEMPAMDCVILKINEKLRWLITW